jgi:hypothetical protein
VELRRELLPDFGDFDRDWERPLPAAEYQLDFVDICDKDCCCQLCFVGVQTLDRSGEGDNLREKPGGMVGKFASDGLREKKSSAEAGRLNMLLSLLLGRLALSGGAVFGGWSATCVL